MFEQTYLNSEGAEKGGRDCHTANVWECRPASSSPSCKW